MTTLLVNDIRLWTRGFTKTLLLLDMAERIDTVHLSNMSTHSLYIQYFYRHL